MSALKSSIGMRTAPVRVLIPCLWVAAAALLLGGCDAWVSAETRVERARTHLDKGQFRPAMAELKSALREQPDHIQARVLLAELSLWLGDLDGADKEIDRALSAGAAGEQVSALRYELLLAQRRFDEVEALLAQDAATPTVRRLVVQAQLETGRGDGVKAEETLKLALRQAPADPQAWLELARVQASRGEIQLALDAPQRVVQSDEMQARAQLLRGSALMTRGDHQQARDAFEKAQQGGSRLRVPEQLAVAAFLTEANLALNEVAAAENSLAKVASWAPDSLLVHYLRARIAMLKNDPVTAIAECQRALHIEPQHIQSQILLAAAHLSQGSAEQGEDVLTRLLASHPENATARKLLAQVYLGRNQPERVQSVLSSAPAGAPDEADAEADWLMGAALLKSGSVSGLQLLERSVAAAPGDDRRRIDLAGAYVAAGRPAEAIALLKTLPPESASTPRAKGLLVLATAAGKPPVEARREIQDLAAKHGDDASLLSAAGAYLAATGDPKRGHELLSRAIQIEPNSIEARMALARLEVNMRNPGAAERRLLEIVKIDPQHQLARVALSELAFRAGDRAQSRKWLEQAIAVDPSAVEARLRLAQLAFIEADPVRARNLLGQALNVSTDRKIVLNAAGKVLAQAGLTDEAFAKFQQASAAGYPDAILEAARLRMDLGQLRKARELIESAVADKPQWREAQRLLVMIDARDGQVERAITRAKSLAGERSPGAQRTLEGDLYAYAGQTSAALTAYTEAQRLQPSAALAVRIFRARRRSGATAAEQSLTQWLARAPGDAEVRGVLAAFYESSGQSELAMAEYERLLADGRIDAAMLNNLAWSLHQKGDPRALALAQRAYAAAPHIAAIGDTYGWILVRMDKVAEGLDVLERALAGTPANPDIQYHAAVAYSRSGRMDRAVELLRQALKSEQKFPSRDAAEQLLQSAAAGS